jgi:hypothetical protein
VALRLVAFEQTPEARIAAAAGPGPRSRRRAAAADDDRVHQLEIESITMDAPLQRPGDLGPTGMLGAVLVGLYW